MSSHRKPPKKKWCQTRLTFAAVQKPASPSNRALGCFSQFNVVSTPLDGNCMYSALIDQLRIPNLSAHQLRLDIVKYLQNHPDIVKNVDFKTEDEMTFDQYVTNMSQDGVWGDGIVLEVAVRMFSRAILIHHTDGNVIKLSAPEISENANPITLGFIPASGTGAGNHYISLHPHENLSQSLPDDPLATDNTHDVSFETNETSSECVPGAMPSDCPRSLDIGDYMNKTSSLPDDLKLDLLLKCWEPPDTYDLKFDATSKRVFRRPWLELYRPWIAYSKSQKGALCRYCVLFPQPVTRGLQGAFIVRPFTNYKDFHDTARSHMNCEWHKASHEAATNFIDTVSGKSVPVNQQISSHEATMIDANRQKLKPIVSSIIFCGTHDIALRGKNITCFYGVIIIIPECQKSGVRIPMGKKKFV